MRRKIILLAVAATSLVLATSGLAAGGKSSSSISLVVLSTSTLTASATSGPSQGDNVTFQVSSDATDRPYVVLNCYQSGTWVYAASAGFYAAYRGSTTFGLETTSWTAGAADCTARLGSLSNSGRFTELASMSFHVSD